MSTKIPLFVETSDLNIFASEHFNWSAIMAMAMITMMERKTRMMMMMMKMMMMKTQIGSWH